MDSSSELEDPHINLSSSDGGRGKRLVLGSSSPRRVELMRAFSDAVEVDPPARPEGPRREGETPVEMVSRLSRDKAEEVAERAGDAVVLAADTQVVLDGESLGKPADGADAARMLGALRGRGARGPHRRHAAGGGTGPDENVGDAVRRYDASVLRRGDLGLCRNGGPVGQGRRVRGAGREVSPGDGAGMLSERGGAATVRGDLAGGGVGYRSSYQARLEAAPGL